MCSLLFLIILVIIVVILYRRGAFAFLMDFMRSKYKEFSGGCDFCNVSGGCEFCGKVNGGCEFCNVSGGNDGKEHLDETITESNEHTDSKFTNCIFEAGQKFNNCEFIGRNMINGDSTLADCNGSGEVITSGDVKLSNGKYETIEHSGEIEMDSVECTHIKICGKMTAKKCTFGSIDIWGDAEGCTKDAKVKLIDCKYEKINAPVDKKVTDLLEEINDLVKDKFTDDLDSNDVDKIVEITEIAKDKTDSTEGTVTDGDEIKDNII